jgi:CheY-like chemotaxis protein/HPt (histidine-containing phosphotransfer) domain-containing protein
MTRLRILIVDDDSLSREVLAVLLDHGDYEVETAKSGDAAVQYLSTAAPTPDVILADMQMPGMTGRALAHELRKLCGAATLLLAMSGSIPDDEAARDFNGFLMKPFTMEELAAAIAEYSNPTETSIGNIHLMALDPAIYDKLAGSMRSERLEQLYSLCIHDTEERITRMRQAASNRDDAAYIKEAHAIQGGTGMVGASELQRLAATMEKKGTDADHVASLNELSVACKRLRRILIAREVDKASRRGERA